MNEDVLTKVCSKEDCIKAGVPQTLDRFGKNGKKAECKGCVRRYNKKYKQEHKEQIIEYEKTHRVQYYLKNQEKIKQKSKFYYYEHKEEKSQYAKEYYQENKERIKQNISQYQKNNKKAINTRRTKRKQTNINFKLACNLRNRVYKAIKGESKSGSALRALGCSIEEAKKHIESTFYFIEEEQQWTMWKNYPELWHIDNIIPLAAFDLTDPEQVKKACHYTNLRALYYKQNISERDRGMSRNKR